MKKLLLLLVLIPQHLYVIQKALTFNDGLVKLVLAGKYLPEVQPPTPEETKDITVIDLSKKGLSIVPLHLAAFTSLTKLYLPHNKFSEFPTEVGQLTGLTDLYLYHNQLAELGLAVVSLAQKTTKVYAQNNPITDDEKEELEIWKDTVKAGNVPGVDPSKADNLNF